MNINPPAILEAIRSQLQGPLSQASAPLADPIVDSINKARSDNKLPPLQVNQMLNNSAQGKSLNMVHQNYWQHDKPQGSYDPGEQPWDTMRKAGYEWQAAGENLARGYTDNDSMMTAWMNSPEHRANILDPDFTQIGVGRNTDNNGHQYVVTHFGKPK